MTTNRDETIAAIRRSLRSRSGKTWSVTGGRGTSWGWITIAAPPARRDRYGAMTPDDAKELATLLAIESAHVQGVLVPPQQDFRDEYTDRAAGRVPSRKGEPQWD